MVTDLATGSIVDVLASPFGEPAWRSPAWTAVTLEPGVGGGHYHDRSNGGQTPTTAGTGLDTTLAVTTTIPAAADDGSSFSDGLLLGLLVAAAVGALIIAGLLMANRGKSADSPPPPPPPVS